MNGTIERRAAQNPGLEADGRRLVGVPMRYGDIAVLPFGRERFEPGAFAPIGDVRLNLQHQRTVLLTRTGAGLTLTDGPDALRMQAELPDVTAAHDTVELVRAGILRGLSVEFRALQERVISGVRSIQRAVLLAIGVVDDPQYEGSTVEARAAIAQARIVIPKGVRVSCGCHRGTCSTVRFGRDAFKRSLAERKELLAVGGQYKDVLGSMKRRTLTVLEDADDALRLGLTIPDTSAGRDLLELAGAVNVLARPFFNQDASTFVERDGVADYSDVELRAVIVGASDADEGWPAVELGEGPGQETARRRARVWL